MQDPVANDKDTPLKAIPAAVPDPSSNEAAEELDPDINIALLRERKRQSRKRARESRKRRRQVNTSVYVTGVPTDASEAELAAHFAKCGILLPSPESGKPRIKLYRDDQGQLKGDALVTYALEPSVENAVAILDGAPLRGSEAILQVQRASFDRKEGEQEEKRQRVEGNEKKGRPAFRSRDFVAEALSWAEEGQEESRGSRIVILKNVFDPNDTDYDILREDMQDGCEACGVVEKITIFERNAEGAVAVKFRTLESCIKCIELMNGRWYDRRKLTAEFYDGVTDYRYRETEEDRVARDKKWEQWLEQGEPQ